MVVPEEKVNEKPPPSHKSQQPILAKKQTTNLLTIRGFLELRMFSFLFGYIVRNGMAGFYGIKLFRKRR